MGPPGGYQQGFQAGVAYGNPENSQFSGANQPPKRFVGNSKEERRTAFIEDWKKKKQQESASNVEEKIVLRDPKAKLITFEIISINRFAVT